MDAHAGSVILCLFILVFRNITWTTISFFKKTGLNSERKREEASVYMVES